jgi:hypothetical protein
MLAAGSDAINPEVVKLLIGKGADTSFTPTTTTASFCERGDKR